MTDLFSKEDYKLIMMTLCDQLKHIGPDKRVKVGALINRMKPLAEGHEVQQLSFKETQILLDSIDKDNIPDDPNMYKSFDDLVLSIRDHNIKTDGPVTIIPNDDLLRFSLGWVCIETGTCWKIRISDMKHQNKDNQNKDKEQLIKKAQQSLEGKQKLASVFSGLGRS